MNLREDRQIPSLQNPRRRPVKLSQPELVVYRPLLGDSNLPLLAQPFTDGVDLALWLSDKRDLVNSLLYQHGGILFRGFSSSSQANFEAAVKALSFELMNYSEGATPRKTLGDRIYSSTEFPASETIALHNELSYVLTWPMKICFYCMQPAEQGGETPISDVRRVLSRIDPEVRRPFIEKGWMLVRNFGDGLGLPWQSSFRTSSKSEVEAYCRSASIQYEWRDQGHLRTRHVRPAVSTHPGTGDLVWFNHVAFWHISSLEPATRDVLCKNFGEDGVPFNTYYGDGSSIEPSVVSHLRTAYEQETITFPWQAGDLLMLDNMLVAHGRSAFKGDRRILVAMGEPYSRVKL